MSKLLKICISLLTTESSSELAEIWKLWKKVYSFLNSTSYIPEGEYWLKRFKIV